MNLHQATQYQISGVGVLEGADIDFGQPTEFPCDECGGMVDLSGVITVTIESADGTTEVREMSEADARALLATVGLPPPPVMCDQHDQEEIVTEALHALDDLPSDCGCGIEIATGRRLAVPACPMHGTELT